MRELRLSLERAKPAALPSLKEALAGIMDLSGAGNAPQAVNEGGGEQPKKRPPPVLDDNLWDEIATEVKRKSMLDPTVSEVALDDDEQQEDTAAESAEGAAPLEEAAGSAESVDALANQIKAHIGKRALVYASRKQTVHCG